MIPPEIALPLFLGGILLVVILMLIDRLEQRTIMLTRQIRERDAEIAEWMGIPRKLLESDL